MPFALMFVGIVFLIVGVKGNSQTFLDLVKGDITGPKNYIYWIISIMVIGALGYDEDLRPFSRAMLVLVLVVLVLKTGNPNGQGGGFFTLFTNSLKALDTNSNTTNA